MDNQGAAGSGGGNQRQSALPSSLIPLMYGPTKLQRASASPARSENTGSSGNPPRTPTPFPSIPPSPSLAFNVRPIDGPPGAPTTPDERPLHTSRFPSGTPEVAKKDRKRAGPSPIPVDSPPESRLGALPLNYETQPPHDYPFGFPPVPRYQHIPYSYYGEDEAGPSTTIQASRERSTSRRTVSGRTLPPLSISTWPGQQAYSPSDEPERPEWAEEQRWHEEQQRQVQSTSELRHASRTQSQSSLPTMSDPSTSAVTYLQPITPVSASPGGLPGLELHPHPVYTGNPYVSQTQSYTPIAPQHYPRYFEGSPVARVPTPQVFPLTQPLTPVGDQSVDSEGEISNTSHRQGKRRAVAYEEQSEQGSSRFQVKQSLSVDDDFDDDDAPRRKVPRKTEVACDFCRRRKLRCDGVRPTCRTCETRKEPCTYVNHVRRRGPGKAPKGSKKLTKRKSTDTATGSGTDAFTPMRDSQTPRTLAARPDSVGSPDTFPRYSPPGGGSMYSAASASPPRLQLRNVPLPHVPSQSPAASTSENVGGSTRVRRRRADQANRPKQAPPQAETDELENDTQDDDMA